ncbi:MAG: hypothetical protein V4594_16790 [Bacteroidota bacterium]
MTYRQEIQTLIEDIDKLNDKAERLRDVAVEQEKGYWNGLRQKLGASIDILNRLDNTLTMARALMEA